MKRRRASLLWVPISVVALCLSISAASQDTEWNLQKWVTGPAPTLRVWVNEVNTVTGAVTINFNDTAHPTTPFAFAWGDGQVDTGLSPPHHTYQDLTRNYVAKVTAHYAGGATGEAEVMFWFVPPDVQPQSLPSALAVTIPDHPITLVSRLPGINPPSNLTFFDDSFLGVVPRATAEYVLTAGAAVEEGLVNENHDSVYGAFQQVILRDPAHGGAQALFYTNPLAVAAGDNIFQDAINWSVLFHEAAHNFQLNSPAGFSFGSKTDSRAGSILSETVARIFQCAAASELINNGEPYGLGQGVLSDIGLSTIDMVKEFRGGYESYVSSGMHFCSWDDPNTSADDPFDSFCALTTRFLVHAEEQKLGYRVPVKRMMRLLQTFDQDALTKYDPYHDSASGAAFRSTYMVAALSFAFNEDLRQEFRDLNFPVTDADYEELWQKADTDPTDFNLNVTPGSLTVPRGATGAFGIGIEALNGFAHSVDLRYLTATEIPGVSLELSDKTVQPGGTATLTVTADTSAQPGFYSIRLRATGEYTAHGSDLALTVISVPVIASASFDGKKTLTILGSGFGSNPHVLINAVDRTARIVSAYDATIVLSGKKKKLGLHKGDNTLIVVDSTGTSSAEFILNL